ncbi:MAG: asparagine synthase (glutamine-hydrolyzing) [Pseudomonadota bacterium]
MCGIVGFVSASTPDVDHLITLRDRLTHRGPDQHGHWLNETVALGHRRLSILDTSDAAKQPLTSQNDRWVLVYNGEVYNFKHLSNELSHITWHTQSDTEVLLEAIAHWGVHEASKKLRGIFAFAAYDKIDNRLYLVRDPVGVKPLYYGFHQNNFYFASQLNALPCQPDNTAFDRSSIHSFLRYRYIPGPATVYQGFQKLTPGSIAEIDCSAHTAKPELKTYWDLAAVATTHPVASREAEPADTLDALLHQVIEEQLVSDVPIGAFLSGGIDSSLVCAIAAQHTSTPLRTFSIGFEDAALDEAPAAAAIAKHLGTDHTQLYVSHQDLLDTVQKLPALCDEPFADASILPTLLVSRLAAEHVTVVLSGDGGDELFWGYTRYATTARLWHSLRAWPTGLRRLAAGILAAPWVQNLGHPIQGLALGGRTGSLDQKFKAASEFMWAPDAPTLYDLLVSHWRSPEEILSTPWEEKGDSIYSQVDHWTRSQPLWSMMANQDFLSYLPDDILTKVDRASMNVSLEARVPLLDQRVVEFAAQLPPSNKAQPTDSAKVFRQKVLLKQLLSRYVPEALTDRPKAGFGVPMDTWLRGPLREWAEDLLAQEKLDWVFDPGPVRQYWTAHLDGRVDNSARLWDVLMLQNWRYNRS